MLYPAQAEGLVNRIMPFFQLKTSQVSWGCRIHQLQSGKIPAPNECPGYDIKTSYGKAPALEIWGMGSTPSMPLLPGPL